MAQWPAQRLRDLSGFGQVRERLLEKGLCVCKRELLGLAQELFPRGGVERRPQAGLILFGEGYGARVEFGKQLLELRGNDARACWRDGRRCRRCCGRTYQGGTEPRQERINHCGKLLQSWIRCVCRGPVAQ